MPGRQASRARLDTATIDRGVRARLRRFTPVREEILNITAWRSFSEAKRRERRGPIATPAPSKPPCPE